MKKNINQVLFALLMLVTINGCTEKEYTLGDLTAPSEVMIVTEVVGQNATAPNGDGSGDVKISVTGKGILSAKIDFDAADGVTYDHMTGSSVTKKYATQGVNTYRITAVAYGKGGTATTVTKEVTVRADFRVSAAIETNLTGGTSKTWVIEKNVQGHFGVGPWMGSFAPDWYAAPPNDKAGCCNCFYTAKFTFTKAAGSYTLQVASPDGAFTKTGALTTLPGIPASGDEGCYPYSGGTSPFTFIASSTATPAASTTKTSIVLAGNNTYIGFGAVQKEYEILSISATNMSLRVQGTETGNAWYLKLIPQ